MKFVRQLYLVFNYIENGTNHTALTSKIKCFVPRCSSAATLIEEILLKVLVSRHFYCISGGIGWYNYHCNKENVYARRLRAL